MVLAHLLPEAHHGEAASLSIGASHIALALAIVH
jgi:hypothetical protein